MAKDEEGCCPSSRTTFIVALANIGSQWNYNTVCVALMMLEKDGPVPRWATSVTTSIVFGGSIVGQLMFGFVGDVVGRHVGLALALGLMALGAAGSGLAWTTSSEATALIYGTMAVWRFITGVAAGGVYPLSATAAFEAKDGETVDNLVRTSYALFFQIPGQILVYLLAAFLADLDGLSWTLKARFVLVSGAVPPLVALPSAIANARTEDHSKQPRRRDLRRLMTTLPWSLQRRLVGACLAWFLFDVYAYGVTVDSPVMVDWIFGDNMTIARDAWFQVLCCVAGVPAVAGSIWLLSIDGDVGRLEAVGFATATAAFCAFAAAWLADVPEFGLFTLFVALRGAVVFGVAVATFVAPALLFPTPIRASCNGIASAAGKFGGLLGTFALLPVADTLGTPALFFLLAFVAAVGVLVTFLLLDAAFLPHHQDLDSLLLLSDSSVLLSPASSLSKHPSAPPDELSHLLRRDDASPADDNDPS